MKGTKLLGAALLLAVVALPVLAALTGDLIGTVLDPTGAVIADATITIRSIDTGVVRTVTSGADGDYAALQLPIGTYEVKVAKSGFKLFSGTVVVRSAEKTVLAAKLELGAAEHVVNVEGTTIPVLDVASAQVSMSLEERRIIGLPLPTRDPLAFASLSPGVIPVSPNNPFLGSGSFNSNGQRGRGNNITLDNITSTDISTTGGAGLGTVSLDGIQEFKLISNNFSAEFGRNAGAQVQLITKGGTNEYHGSAYWFHQNRALNARDYFDTTGRSTPFIRNQWGFTAGGPIIKNRTFAFGHYEGLKIRGAGDTRTATVLTPAQQAAITDPTSGALFAALGAPTSGTGTISNAAPNVTDSYSWSVRLDQTFRDGKDLLTARYGEQTASVVSPGLTFIAGNLTNYGASSVNVPRNFNLGHTHTFSQSMVNEFRFAFGRSRPQFAPNSNLATPFAPVVNIAGFASLGLSNILPQGRVQNTFQYSDTMSWVVGKHTLKFGGDVFRYQANSGFDSNLRGTFTFASIAAFQAGTPATFTQNFGSTARGNRSLDAFAFIQDDVRLTSFLTLNIGLRLESSGGVSEVDGLLSNLNRNDFASLGGGGTGALGTIELGGTAFNRNTNWAPRFGLAWNPSGGKLVVRGGYGWAYDFIFLNPITNLRFAPPFVPAISVQTFAGGNTFAALVGGTSTAQANAQAAIGVFSPTQVNFGALSAVNQSLKNPRADQWNIGIQYQVLRDLVLKGSYVGTKGNFLQITLPVNLMRSTARPASATSEADELARFAAFQAAFVGLSGSATAPSNRIDGRFNNVNSVESAGSSIFHAFEFEANKRFNHGYTVNASYTWGHSIDDASDVLGVLVNDSAAIQNPLDLRNNRASSQFDVRQRFVLNHLWELPWGKGFQGAAKRVLDGWAFSGIFQLQSGFPASIFSGSRRGIADVLLMGGGTGGIRANVVSGGTFIPVPQGSPAAASIPAPCARGVNTSGTSTCTNTSGFVFTQPLLGSAGNSGRNLIRLNGLTQFDWSIMKKTAITERQSMEFRFEMFNVFNNTSFSGFNGVLTSPSFGLYQQTDTNARRMQFALRYQF